MVLFDDDEIISIIELEEETEVYGNDCWGDGRLVSDSIFFLKEKGNEQIYCFGQEPAEYTMSEIREEMEGPVLDSLKKLKGKNVRLIRTM